jgi:hypothetical protein
LEKKIKIILLISVILLLLGPTLGFFLDKITLCDQNVSIPETSNTNIQDAFAFDFSLGKNQKIVVEFSVSTPNDSLTLKFMRKANFDEEYAASTAPTSITGLRFIYNQFVFMSDPTVNDALSVAISESGQYYIEFSGDATTSGNHLISVPGDYVAFVYGTDSQAGTHVAFNIKIRADGPGAMIELWCILIGIIVLVAIMLLTTYGYLNKTRRGLL